VLLVAYDSQATGPLATVSPSRGLLGAALVLSRHARTGAPRLQVQLAEGDAPEGTGALARHAAGGNAMAPMLPLFDALARNEGHAMLRAGPGRVMRIAIG